MAVYFFLAAECGPTEADAVRFAAHFESLVLRLSTGLEVACSSYVKQRDEEGNFWAEVIPRGAGYAIPRRPGERFDPYLQSDAGLSEIGHALYRHLRTAPAYRYATYCAEVEYFATYDWLMSPEASYFTEGGDGLVVSEEIWRQAGEPQHFEPFSPGYRWQPFRDYAERRAATKPEA